MPEVAASAHGYVCTVQLHVPSKASTSWRHLAPAGWSLGKTLNALRPRAIISACHDITSPAAGPECRAVVLAVSLLTVGARDMPCHDSPRHHLTSHDSNAFLRAPAVPRSARLRHSQRSPLTLTSQHTLIREAPGHESGGEGVRFAIPTRAGPHGLTPRRPSGLEAGHTAAPYRLLTNAHELPWNAPIGWADSHRGRTARHPLRVGRHSHVAPGFVILL